MTGVRTGGGGKERDRQRYVGEGKKGKERKREIHQGGEEERTNLGRGADKRWKEGGSVWQGVRTECSEGEMPLKIDVDECE